MTVSPPAPRILFVAANPAIDRFIEVTALTPGSIHRPEHVVAVPGGKGLNAARAAFALGGRVTALAIVAGRAGEWIAERLATLDIESSLVRDPSGTETRTCLSVLDRSTGLLTEFYEPGEGIAPGTWAALEGAIARELKAGDVGAVVCSGSLPDGAPIDGYARIAGLARGRSVPLVVDCHGAALEAVLAERPSVVKVNAKEAAEAAGNAAAEPQEAARALVRRGATWAVVTLGPDGAIACDGATTWRLRAPGPAGRYPVGSGDAFLAGLTLAMVGSASLLDAARRGVAAGTANAFVPGAGMLDAGAAARLLTLVTVDYGAATSA